MKQAQLKSGRAQLLLPRALLWGISMVFVGLVIFSITTYSLLTESLLFATDQRMVFLFAQFANRVPEWAVEALKLLGELGSDGTALFSLGLILYSLVRKSYRQMLLLVTSVGGGELVWLALVFWFDRPRPAQVSTIGGINLPSYPSGHTELAITVFGTLLYLYSSKGRSRFWRLAVVAFVLAWAVISGAIRLILGVHYLTDVLAGYALGLIWTGAAILIVDGWWWSRGKES